LNIPEQKARNQKTAVRNTHGCRFAGIRKIFGARAAALSSTVDMTPNHSKIRRPETTDLSLIVMPVIA
jgi:hypothetical protein